jgi:CheY-like chemotaxis protein
MHDGESLSGLRILVVEDEALIAWALADCLESRGCEVVGPAYDLEEALSLSREATLDGAFLDVNLGRQKVFPAADVLAERGIPFCFVTGYGVSALRPEDLRRPVLQKPVEAADLMRVVATWRKAPSCAEKPAAPLPAPADPPAPGTVQRAMREAPVFRGPHVQARRQD